MRLNRLSFFLLFFVSIACIINAQVSGDYRSKGSGNWNNYASWQVYNGSSWSDAVSGQTPDSDNSVYIQSGHLITLTQNESCYNFNIAKGNSLADATFGRVQLVSYNLSIYGIMRNYYAAVGSIPGTNSDAMPNAPILTSSTTGKVIIKGATRNLTSTGSWQTDGPMSYPSATHYTGSTTVYNLEIDPGTGVTITIPTGMRPQSWNIVSGTIDMGSVPKEADTGTSGTGDITIGANAIVFCNLPTGIAVFRRSNSLHAGAFTLNGILIVSGEQTNINMNSYALNGVVEYNRAGNQFFLRNFVSGVGTPSTHNDVTLSGSGIKSLYYDATINGTFSIAGTATFSLNAKVLTYGGSSTLAYQGTSSQTTANSEFPASGGPTHVLINNSNGVTLNGGKTITGNLTLFSGTLAMGANSFNVQGTTYVVGGSYSGGTGYTDGYWDIDGRYIFIMPNDDNIASFSASTSVVSNMPDRVDREWTISGSYTGSKEITLYWNASEDDSYPWVISGKVPSVYIDGTEFTQIAYDVSGDPRWVQVSIPTADFAGTYQIGAADEETLPVELSSFSAVLTADFLVKLHWTTQSETGVSGFYLYRGTVNDLTGAIAVSTMIEATNTTAQHVYEFVDSELFDPGTYYYWLSVQNLDGSVNYHGPTTVFYDNTASHGSPEIPVVNGLNAIYPNPFNPSTTIAYSLSKNANVSFSIYNSRGQIVRQIAETQKAAGNWRLNWDGMNDNGTTCSTGVYYIKMIAGNDSFMKKAVLLK